MPLIIPTNRDDTLAGTLRSDLMSGLAGNDTLFGGAGRDYFVDGEYTWEGEDVSLPGSVRPYLVYGRNYDFGAGSDVYNGGDGYDRLIYANRPAPVTVNLRDSTVLTDAGTDRFAGIEAIYLTSGDDLVLQRSGRPTVLMGSGNDLAVVRTMGLSDMRAGAGRDTLDLTATTSRVELNLAMSGGVTVGASHANIRGFEVYLGSLTAVNHLDGSARRENFTGGSANDILNGNGGNDRIVASSGNDQLDGGSGNDRLWGGDGADTIFGGTGYDRIFGGAGDDEIEDHSGGGIIRAGNGQDMIRMNGGTSRAYGGFGNDTFHIASGTAFGGAGSDTFYATHYSDVLGDDGRDIFYLSSVADYDYISGNYFGGSGNDLFEVTNSHNAQIGAVIEGGSGNDHLIVRGGGSFHFDTYVEGMSGTGMVSNVEYTTFMDGTYEIEVLNGAVGLELQTSNGASVLIAGGNGHLAASYGDDAISAYLGDGWVIDGRSGNDTIDAMRGTILGGQGNDRITITGQASVDAGIGNDTVIIDADVANQADQIDLGSGNDRLEVLVGLAFADLGHGADYAEISYIHDQTRLDLGSPGDGADIASVDAGADGTLLLDHFDLAQDRLAANNLWTAVDPFDSLSDFVVTQDGTDAVLTRVHAGGNPDYALVIRLTDVSAASLTDDIFA